MTFEFCSPGYEDVVWIPKGSVHIFIQDLNLSLSHLGKQRWGVRIPVGCGGIMSASDPCAVP